MGASDEVPGVTSAATFLIVRSPGVMVSFASRFSNLCVVTITQSPDGSVVIAPTGIPSAITVMRDDGLAWPAMTDVPSGLMRATSMPVLGIFFATDVAAVAGRGAEAGGGTRFFSAANWFVTASAGLGGSAVLTVAFDCTKGCAGTTVF